MYAHNQQWLASRARTHSLKAPAVVCHLPPTVRSAAQHSHPRRLPGAAPGPPAALGRSAPCTLRTGGRRRTSSRPAGRGGEGGEEHSGRSRQWLLGGWPGDLLPPKHSNKTPAARKRSPKKAQQPSSPKRHTFTLFSPAPVPQYTTTPSPPQQHSPQPASPLRAPSPCGRQTPPAAPP